MERTVYLCSGNEVQAQDLYLDMQQDSAGNDSLAALPPSKLLKEQMDAYEKKLLIRALKEQSSIRQAAVHLGISHTAVLQKMKKHGLS